MDDQNNEKGFNFLNFNRFWSNYILIYRSLRFLRCAALGHRHNENNSLVFLCFFTPAKIKNN